MHMGHVSVIKTLELLCDDIQILFYYDQDYEKRLISELGIEYSVDDRISDARKIFEYNNHIRFKKLVIPPNTTYPADREKVKDLVKRLVGDNVDLQIFGFAERDLCEVNKCAKDYLLATMYQVENVDNEIVSLCSTLIRSDLEYYKKFLPHIVSESINRLS